ncbi:transcription factor bHLH94-like [Amaranthus tricolor]|uniref:transcription factor bHLH94-like n=1 Tax=Amaranthus tricolor TaxID=29722 RepID=UPI0025851A8E|nr:transcription factor bHLH94-like [Amaranthus tricolor]
MALDAPIYYQQQDLFGHNNGTNNNHIYPLLQAASSSYFPDYTHDSFFKTHDQSQQNLSFSTFNQDYYSTFNDFLDDNPLEFDWHSYYYNNHGIINHELPQLNSYDYECWGLVDNNNSNSNNNNCSSSPDHEQTVHGGDDGVGLENVRMRPKQRRRARAKKNKEEIENQRMTHIAVERNRRKQMNEYLNMLRDLMPHSYVQRGDQASIVGAAINFVKELEHNLQNLSAKKQMKENINTKSTLLPFEDFFSFPQFSSNAQIINDDPMMSGDAATSHHHNNHREQPSNGGLSGADVEVSMVESHAHLKIRLRRSLKHLSKLVSGLHCLRLVILHLNVNTSDDGVVLYTFSLKVEDESKLSSVDEIARAVYELLGRIQEENN